MVRPTIDLEAHKDEIISLFQSGASPNAICVNLRDTYGLTVASLTIRRRLDTWGIERAVKPYTTTDLTLHERLKTLISEVGLSDKQIATILQTEGSNISPRTLQRLRLRLGIERHSRYSKKRERQPKDARVPQNQAFDTRTTKMPGNITQSKSYEQVAHLGVHTGRGSPHRSRLSPSLNSNRASLTNRRLHPVNMGMKARCQCGKIQFTTPTDKPLKLWICHCTECQHQSSSAFGITATFPYFELPESTSGLVGSYTRVTTKGRDMECLFCKSCGARLLHRFRDAVPAPGEQPSFSAITNVKGGCLEDMNKEMLRNAVHIWCQEAIIDIPEGVEKWDEGPPQPNPLVT